MAGFFGLFDYSRPGPGVSKEAPQKHRFFLFFEVFFRKFSKLILINMLYLVSCIPIVTIGPATAGFTYIMRNFSREEHAFLWMDYRDTIKANWKQALVASLINAACMLLLVFAIPFWYQQYLHNVWMVVPFAFCASAGLVFVFMQYYLYVMMITFRLNLLQLYKNAFFFAFLGILPNLLLTAVIGILGYLLFVLTQVMPLVGWVLVIAIAFSFFGLLINFVVWPVLKKYMIDPYYSQHPEEKAGEQQEDGAVFTDRGVEKHKK